MAEVRYRVNELEAGGAPRPAQMCKRLVAHWHTISQLTVQLVEAQKNVKSFKRQLEQQKAESFMEKTTHEMDGRQRQADIDEIEKLRRQNKEKDGAVQDLEGALSRAEEMRRLAEEERRIAIAELEKERIAHEKMMALRNALGPDTVPQKNAPKSPTSPEQGEKQKARKLVSTLDELRMMLHELNDPETLAQILAEVLRIEQELRPPAEAAASPTEPGSPRSLQTTNPTRDSAWPARPTCASAARRPTWMGNRALQQQQDDERWARWQRRLQALKRWQRASLECLCRLLSVEESAQIAIKNRRLAVIVKRKIRTIEDYLASTGPPKRPSSPQQAVPNHQYVMDPAPDAPAVPLRAQRDLYYCHALTGGPSAFELAVSDTASWQAASALSSAATPRSRRRVGSAGSSRAAASLVRSSTTPMLADHARAAPLPALPHSAPAQQHKTPMLSVDAVLRNATEVSLPGLPASIAMTRERRAMGDKGLMSGSLASLTGATTGAWPTHATHPAAYTYPPAVAPVQRGREFAALHAVA